MSEPIIKRTESADSANFSNPVTFSYARREVRLVSVTEIELDTISSLNNSVHLAFLGMAFGAFLVLIITLKTVQIDDPKTFAGFVAATIISGIATLFFGVRARISFREAQKKLVEMKSGAAN